MYIFLIDWPGDTLILRSSLCKAFNLLITIGRFAERPKKTFGLTLEVGFKEMGSNEHVDLAIESAVFQGGFSGRSAISTVLLFAANEQDQSTEACATCKWKSSRPSALPEIFKAAVEMTAAQSENRVGAPHGPEHSRSFEAGANYSLAARFDYTGANKQMLASKLGISHALRIPRKIVLCLANCNFASHRHVTMLHSLAVCCSFQGHS